jgi:hypothetical protein
MSKIQQYFFIGVFRFTSGKMRFRPLKRKLRVAINQVFYESHDQHAFAAAAVKLPVENLFPRAGMPACCSEDCSLPGRQSGKYQLIERAAGQWRNSRRR